MIGRILVAIDRSQNREIVFNQAVSLTKALNAKLMLLHVLSPLDQGYPTPIYPGPDSIYPSLHEEAIRSYIHQWQAFEQGGLDLLRSLTEKASSVGVVADFTQNAGEPGVTICDVARTWSADLIIVGRRGHSGVRQLILGSVSNYVLHHAPCSVLVVQGELSSSLKGEVVTSSIAT